MLKQLILKFLQSSSQLQTCTVVQNKNFSNSRHQNFSCTWQKTDLNAIISRHQTTVICSIFKSNSLPPFLTSQRHVTTTDKQLQTSAMEGLSGIVSHIWIFKTGINTVFTYRANDCRMGFNSLHLNSTATKKYATDMMCDVKNTQVNFNNFNS